MQKPGELTLVCPKSERLLGLLRGKSLVVRVPSTDEIQDAYDRAGAENSVHCIAVEERNALSAIPLRDEWKAIPIFLQVPEMGDFKKVLKRIRQLRELNIRVFMPAARADNLVSQRILSSLLVPTGLVLAPPLDWVAVNDLMHYAVYTRTPHADIEPFGYVKSSYNPQEFTYLQTPIFENPLKYAHIDEQENIALSAAGLLDGRWIGRGLESLPGLCESAEYRHSLNSWQAIFLENRRCSYCPAWRLCQGTFFADCEQEENVYRFFEDFITAADASYAARQAGAKWQP
jgi:hypothetical protein